jgi:DNA polymerase III subunit beta
VRHASFAGRGEAAVKFTVARQVLADAVGWAVRAVSPRPAAPVLAGIRLLVSGTRLHVAGFDGDIAADVEVPVDPGVDGAVLVHGRLLADYVKALPDRAVQVTATATELEVACGAGSFALPLMPVDEHPGTPPPPAVIGSVEAGAFATAVGQVAGAASPDQAVPVLTAVHLRSDSGLLTLVATDRYRLAASEVAWRAVDGAAEVDALVPGRILAEAARAFGPLGGQLALAGGSRPDHPLMSLRLPDRSITTRLFDDVQYPPVHRLLDVNRPVRARVRAADLVDAVRRVALAADRASPVRLTFDRDHVVVRARGAHEARAHEQLPAESAGGPDGRPLTVALKADYLLDGLRGLTGPVAVLSFVDGTKPPLITAETDEGDPVTGYRYLIQPVRTPG